MHLLSILIFLPIIGGLLILLICGTNKYPLIAKILAITLSLSGVLLLIPIFNNFTLGEPNLQLQDLFSIITRRFDAKGNVLDANLPINVFYYVGVDGLSLWFIFANAILSFLAILYSTTTIHNRLPQFLALFLIISGLVNGSFLAGEGLIFYMFFELALILMFFVIGIWGGDERIKASFKYIVFILIGSVFLFVSFTYLFVLNSDFIIDNIPAIVAIKINVPTELIGWTFSGNSASYINIVFLGLFIGFAIKTPLFPFHLWLPDSHTQAPTSASVILAGIMLKLGVYGILRIALPVQPDGGKYFAPLIIGLCLIAIIYFAIILFRETNIKKFIAYSSIINMSMALVGIFIYQFAGLNGAVFLLISHCFISAGLFFAVGMLYEKTGSYEINALGGLINVLPKLTILFFLLILANVGVPLSSGFVGELLIIIGTNEFNILTSAIIGLGIILVTISNFYLFKKVFLGAITNPNLTKLSDISIQNLIILIIIVLIIYYFGINPNSIFNYSEATLQRLFYLINVSKIN